MAPVDVASARPAAPTRVPARATPKHAPRQRPGPAGFVPREGDAEQLWAGRTAGALFVLGGAIGILGILLPHRPEVDPVGNTLVSVAAMLIGVVVGRLPWGRWPISRTRVVLPIGLITVALGNLQGVDPFIYPNFYILIFAWAGVWHPRFTSLKWAIPAAVAYVGPLLLQGRPAVDIASTASVVPIWVLVGETMAWVAARFRTTLAETRMAEARQRLMYEQMPAVVWSTDRGLRLTSAAGSALATHGFDVQMLLGSNPFELFGLTESSASFASREALLGSPASFEIEFDGRVYQGRVDPLRDASGDVVGTVGLGVDATDLKGAERRAEASRSLLEAALDSTAEGVLVVDTTGKMVASNARFAEMWGIPREVVDSGDDEAAIAFVLQQLTDPDEFVRRVRELYAHPEAESRDVLRFLDGRVFERVSRPQMQHGRAVGRVWSFRDVSDRVRGEETLRRQTEELQALHTTTLGLLNEVDAGGVLAPIVERAAALMATDHAWVYVVDPGTDELEVRIGTGIFTANVGYRLKRGDGLAGRVWESGRTMSVDDYGHWNGGRPEFSRLHSVMGTPMRVRGEIVGVIGVASADPARRFSREDQALLSRFGQMASLALHHANLLDAAQDELAERERSEEALREAYEREHQAASQLRRLNEMKNAFLTAVSHELRTPLTSVVGYADTLQRWHLRISADEREQMLTRLARNARKLDRLLTDLLDVDRLTRGILKPNLKNTEIGALVRGVVENADYLEGRPVKVETASMVMKVDGPKVERIVENLLSNAVRHTSPGTQIWVKARRVPEGVLLEVNDAGRGIPQHVAETIFEPFQQGPERVEHSPGVGIGLSLVARFAEMHHGRAWVESELGKGASFKVLLREIDGHTSEPLLPAAVGA